MNKILIEWDYVQKTTHRKTYNNDVARETIFAANGIINTLGRMGFRPTKKEQIRIANKLQKRITKHLSLHPYVPDEVYPIVTHGDRIPTRK